MELQIFIQASSSTSDIPLWSDDKDYLISLTISQEPNKPASFKNKPKTQIFEISEPFDKSFSFVLPEITDDYDEVKDIEVKIDSKLPNWIKFD